jgi:hypothetical protein
MKNSKLEVRNSKEFPNFNVSPCDCLLEWPSEKCKRLSLTPRFSEVPRRTVAQLTVPTVSPPAFSNFVFRICFELRISHFEFRSA